MLTASELKSLLKAHGLRLTKRLGQHHLIDAQIARRIVEACGLSFEDTVVEIGAGLGALTELLAERAARVLAVEVDRRISELLAERLAWAKRVTVLHQDILEFSWGDCDNKVVVVGAIPYHITSPILVSLSDARRVMTRAILILQEEVARRLLARPGTKSYGRLSVLAQYCWELSPLMTISRSAFFPQPEVDSRCVRLTVRPQPPVAVVDEPLFFELVKIAFSHRRKTLVNCLSTAEHIGMGHAQAETLVRELGVSGFVRGEALSLSQFAALANAIADDR